MASSKSEKEVSDCESMPDLEWPDNESLPDLEDPDDRNNMLIGQARFIDYDLMETQERDYTDFAKRLAESKINFWEICPRPEVFYLTGVNRAMFTKKRQRMRNQFIKVSSKAETEFMENIKQCGVCFDSMTEENHSMLPCQHTFCKNCIENLNRFKPSDEIYDDGDAFIVVNEGAFNGFDPGIDDNEIEEVEFVDDYDISCPNCRAKYKFPKNGLIDFPDFPKNDFLSDILKIEKHKDVDIIIRREKRAKRSSNRCV